MTIPQLTKMEIPQRTPLGQAVSEMDADLLQRFLEDGTWSANGPCFVVDSPAASAEIDFESTTLVRFLADAPQDESESNPDADAALVLLLTYGADPAKQAKDEEKRKDLVEGLFDYALRCETNPLVLERLCDLDAHSLYPGGMRRMHNIINTPPRDLNKLWDDQKRKTLLAAVQWSMSSPVASHQEDWVSERVTWNPTRVLRPSCSCPSGLPHKPERCSEWPYDLTVPGAVVTQPKALHMSQDFDCRCGRLVHRTSP